MISKVGICAVKALKRPFLSKRSRTGEFFAPAWRLTARLAEIANMLYPQVGYIRDAWCRQTSDKLPELTQRISVVPDSSLPQLSAPTVSQVPVNSVSYGGMRKVWCIDRPLVGLPAVEQFLGSCPVAGPNGAAYASLSDRVGTVNPNRTLALSVTLPFRPVGAGDQMATMKFKWHGVSVPNSGTRLAHEFFCLVSALFSTKRLGRLTGFGSIAPLKTRYLLAFSLCGLVESGCFGWSLARVGTRSLAI